MCATVQTVVAYRIMLGVNFRNGLKAEGLLIMLFKIAVVFVVLWALGLASGTTMGGFIHILLVLAAVILVFQLVIGQRNG